MMAAESMAAESMAAESMAPESHSLQPGGCRPDWVAVDGPAGAGKSTLARALARALGFRYVDTGASYRAAALAVLEAGLDPQQEKDWPAIVQVVARARIELGTDPHQEGPTRVWLNGVDVSLAVRSLEVGRAASAVARIPEVRQHLAAWQRRLAELGPCVMDGRDIGTVVLADACVKLYVTASLEERARRRARELAASPGAGEVALQEVMREIERRDRQDASRAAAPLMPAKDACILDTTGLDVEQAVALALQVVRERLGRDRSRSTG